MTKKMLAVSLVLGLVLAAVSFANGQKEPGAAAVPGQAGNEQKLVLTGSLSFQNLVHPTLKSGDKVYELMVPRFLVYQANLKEGAQVTVEGYEVRGMVSRAQGPGDDGNIDVMVTKATINGKDYDLSQFRGRMAGGYGRGMGMMGRRGGGYGMMGGGYGRGYGMMGGYGQGDGPGCGF